MNLAHHFACAFMITNENIVRLSKTVSHLTNLIFRIAGGYAGSSSAFVNMTCNTIRPDIKVDECQFGRKQEANSNTVKWLQVCWQISYMMFNSSCLFKVFITSSSTKWLQCATRKNLKSSYRETLQICQLFFFTHPFRSTLRASVRLTSKSIAVGWGTTPYQGKYHWSPDRSCGKWVESCDDSSISNIFPHWLNASITIGINHSLTQSLMDLIIQWLTHWREGPIVAIPSIAYCCLVLHRMTVWRTAFTSYLVSLMWLPTSAFHW